MCFSAVIVLAGGQSRSSSEKSASSSPTVSRRKTANQWLQQVSSLKTVESEVAAEHLPILTEQRENLDVWGYRDAYLYWLRQRSFPNTRVDWRVYVQAFLHQIAMPKLKFRIPPGAPGVAIVQPRWEFIGPVKLPVPYRQYYGQGFTSGRVNGLAFDPTNPSTIYLASAGGGAWKTTDKGQTWTPLSDNWDNTKTSSVAVDPTTSTTVYVGTGDFDGGVGVYGFGIMKSIDGGSHWSNLARNELKGFSIHRILIYPDDHNTLIVAAGRNPFAAGKLLISENGGTDWHPAQISGVQQPITGEWQDISCGQPFGPAKRHCFATASGSERVLLRSDDRGQHWEKLSPPLSASAEIGFGVAASAVDADTVYLLSGTDKKVLKSTNAGTTWSDISGRFPNGDEIRKNYNWSQADYDLFIQTARNDDGLHDRVYVGLIDVVASLDGGTTWNSVGQSFDANDAHIHNDQHCLAANPNDVDNVILGNDGGVYSATFDPHAHSWSFDTTLNAQLGLTQLYKVAPHPQDQQFVLLGAQDNASPAAFGDFGSWSNIGGGDGGFVQINPAHPDIQYVTEEYLSNIFRTEKHWTDWDPDQGDNIAFVDGGGSWSDDPVSFVGPIVLDPSNPSRLYAGTNYLWRWNDDQKQWERHVGSKMLAQPGDPRVSKYQRDAIAVIAVAPSDSKTIYTGSEFGQLWASTNEGNNGSWKRIDNADGLPTFSITSIAVHPTIPDTILVGYSGTATPHPGHLWKCVKLSSQPRCQPATGSADATLPNIPINAVVIDRQKPDTIYYVATDIGVFMTKDGGSTWGDATKPLGLPNVQVNDLSLVPGTKYLLAATFGRGLWRIQDLASASVQPRVQQPLRFRTAAVRRQ